MMDAAAVSSLSKQKLLAMVQRAKSDSDDEDAGAPAGAVYESKAGGIVDVLEETVNGINHNSPHGDKSEGGGGVKKKTEIVV